MELIVKFLTVGFIVKDLLSYFCKHSIPPMSVLDWFRIPGQYLSLKAFKITKFALRYIHSPIYFKLPLNCNVNATVVILYSSDSNCKINMLSALTHFFSIIITTGLVLLIWSPQIWKTDYNGYVWCMEWLFRRASIFHCELKLCPKTFYTYRRISLIFLFCQESYSVDSIVSVLSPISTFPVFSIVRICEGYLPRCYH